MADAKFRIVAGAYNLLDYMEHPILHATDGRGLNLHLPSRHGDRRVGVKFYVKVVAKDRNGRVTGVRYHDGSCIALAQLMQTNIFDTAETIKDTGGTNRSISVNQACTSPYIVAGTGTSAAFSDNALGSQSTGTSGYATVTVNAVSSNAFTVTANIVNGSGSTITYSEVGMTVVNSTYTFLIAHDTFTGLPVSNGGTLAVTYTGTFT